MSPIVIHADCLVTSPVLIVLPLHMRRPPILEKVRRRDVWWRKHWPEYGGGIRATDGGKYDDLRGVTVICASFGGS